MHFEMHIMPGLGSNMYLGQVMELRLSCYLVLLSIDSKLIAKPGIITAAVSWHDPFVFDPIPAVYLHHIENTLYLYLIENGVLVFWEKKCIYPTPVYH